MTFCWQTGSETRNDTSQILFVQPIVQNPKVFNLQFMMLNREKLQILTLEKLFSILVSVLLNYLF